MPLAKMAKNTNSPIVAQILIMIDAIIPTLTGI